VTAVGTIAAARADNFDSLAGISGGAYEPFHTSKFADRFEQAIRQLIPIERAEWLPAVDATWLDERDAIFKNRFGVYFYSSIDGDVLHVGTRQDSTLLQRVWSHLARPPSDRHDSINRVGLSLYPPHQLNALGAEPAGPAVLLERGEFVLDALAITLNHLAGLFESFALTAWQLSEGCLPPLNRKLG
jgi:hypothetical protein